MTTAIGKEKIAPVQGYSALPAGPSEATALSETLRDYANDPGWSHGDNADTMRSAADEIDRLSADPLPLPAGQSEQPMQQQPIIGKLLDDVLQLQTLWGLNEPGALVRLNDVTRVLIAAAKSAPTPLAVPLPADQNEATIASKTLNQWWVTACESSAHLKEADACIKRYQKLVEELRAAAPLPLPAGPNEPILTWEARIYANHPRSDPQYWPDKLKTIYMSEEIADLRTLAAAPVIPPAVDQSEDAYLIDRLSKLLAGVAIALKGPEPVLTRWSYHDLPEIAATLMLELEIFRANESAAPLPLPAGPSEQPPVSMTTDDAREYLVEYMMKHFTDKTYHRYIRGQRGQVNLAGDFAWQLATALAAAPAAPPAVPEVQGNTLPKGWKMAVDADRIALRSDDGSFAVLHPSEPDCRLSVLYEFVAALALAAAPTQTGEKA
jgi:hypothetical protein